MEWVERLLLFQNVEGGSRLQRYFASYELKLTISSQKYLFIPGL